MTTSEIRRNECPRFARKTISDLRPISSRTTRTITAIKKTVPIGLGIRDCGKGTSNIAVDPQPEAP